jgi:hypothetical protein
MDFSVFYNIHAGLGSTQLAEYLRLFPWKQSECSLKLTTLTYVVPRLRMCKVLPLLFLYLQSMILRPQTTLHFYCTIKQQNGESLSVDDTTGSQVV